MILNKLFPCATYAFLALSVLSVAASAQTSEIRLRKVAQNIAANDLPAMTEEPGIVSIESLEEIKAPSVLNLTGPTISRLQQIMSSLCVGCNWAVSI